MKALALSIALLLPFAVAGTSAASAPPVVQLGGADPFAVLAGTAISDVPTSTIIGNVGVSPAAGSLITGLTCAEVTGTIYSVDASGPACRVTDAGLLTTAKNNLTTAYDDAAARTPDGSDLVGQVVPGDNQLGGRAPLVPGVYRFAHATTANLIGDLTLSGNADAVWIFQATSDFVTAAGSTVTLTGGAQSCHVFWQVGSAATLGNGSTLRGTILAHDDISLPGSVTVDGRLLAGGQANHAGAVTLINDTITKPATCVTQASIDAAAAAAAKAQAEATAAAAKAQAEATAAANAAAEAQAAAEKAAAAAKAADVAAATTAAEKAAAAAATAAQAAATAQAAADKAAAVAAKAVVAKAAAAKAAKAAQVAKAAARRAATARATAVKLAAIRNARVHAGFTG